MSNKLILEPGVQLISNGVLGISNFTDIVLDDVDLYAGGNAFIYYVDGEGHEYLADVTDSLGIMALNDITITGGTTLETDKNNIILRSIQGALNIDGASSITSGNDITIKFLSNITISENASLEASNDINMTMQLNANRYVQDKIVSVSSDSTLTAGNDVTISADREILLDGAITAGNLTSITSKYGDIHSTNANSLITTKDITLSAEYGAIEGINVDLTASEVNAVAFNNVEIAELDSDIDVGIITSKYGDVILSTAGGSILLDVDAEITAGRMVDLDADQNILVDGIITAYAGGFDYRLLINADGTIDPSSNIEATIFADHIHNISFVDQSATAIELTGNVTGNGSLTVYKGTAEVDITNNSLYGMTIYRIDNSLTSEIKINNTSVTENFDNITVAFDPIYKSSTDINITHINNEDIELYGDITNATGSINLTAEEARDLIIGGSTLNPDFVVTLEAHKDININADHPYFDGHLIANNIFIDAYYIDADTTQIFASGDIEITADYFDYSGIPQSMVSNGDIRIMTDYTRFDMIYSILTPNGKLIFSRKTPGDIEISSTGNYSTPYYPAPVINSDVIIGNHTDTNSFTNNIYINSNVYTDGNDIEFNATGSITTDFYTIISSRDLVDVRAEDHEIALSQGDSGDISFNADIYIEFAYGNKILAFADNGFTGGKVNITSPYISIYSTDIKTNEDINLEATSIELATGSPNSGFYSDNNINILADYININERSGSGRLIAGNNVNLNALNIRFDGAYDSNLDFIIEAGNDIVINAIEGLDLEYITLNSGNTLTINAGDIENNGIVFLPDAIETTNLVSDFLTINAPLSFTGACKIGNFQNAIIDGHPLSTLFTDIDIAYTSTAFTSNNYIELFGDFIVPGDITLDNNRHQVSVNTNTRFEAGGNIQIASDSIVLTSDSCAIIQASNITLDASEELRLKGVSLSANNMTINAHDINENGIVFVPDSIETNTFNSNFIENNQPLNLTSSTFHAIIEIGNLDNIFINSEKINITSVYLNSDYDTRLIGDNTIVGDITLIAEDEALIDGNVTSSLNISLMGDDVNIKGVINATNINLIANNYIIDPTASITANNNVIFSRATAGNLEISDAGNITPQGIGRANGNIIIGNHADTNSLTSDIGINSNIYTDGNPITFNGTGTITVLDNVLISSRDLEDVWSDNHLNADSQGDSGDIIFTANNLNLNTGSTILAFTSYPYISGDIEANITNNLNSMGGCKSDIIRLKANTINASSVIFYSTYNSNSDYNHGVYLLNINNSSSFYSDADIAFSADYFNIDETTSFRLWQSVIFSRATAGDINIGSSDMLTPQMILTANDRLIHIGNHDKTNNLTDNINIKSNVYTDGPDLFLYSNDKITVDNNVTVSTRNLVDVLTENHQTALSEFYSGSIWLGTDGGDIELKENSALLANGNNGFTDCGYIVAPNNNQNVLTSGLIKADKITIAASNNIEASGDMISDTSLSLYSDSGNITQANGSLMAPSINLTATNGTIGTASDYIVVESNNSTINMNAYGNIYLDSLYGNNSYSLKSTAGMTYLKLHNNIPEPIANILIPTLPIVEVPILDVIPQEIVINTVETPAVEEPVQVQEEVINIAEEQEPLEEVLENTAPEVLIEVIEEGNQPQLTVNDPVIEINPIDNNEIIINNNIESPVETHNEVTNNLNQPDISYVISATPAMPSIMIDYTVQLTLNKAIIIYNEALLNGIGSSNAFDMAVDVLIDSNITREKAKELIDSQLIKDSAYIELLEQFVLLEKVSIAK